MPSNVQAYSHCAIRDHQYHVNKSLCECVETGTVGFDVLYSLGLTPTLLLSCSPLANTSCSAVQWMFALALWCDATSHILSSQVCLICLISVPFSKRYYFIFAKPPCYAVSQLSQKLNKIIKRRQIGQGWMLIAGETAADDKWLMPSSQVLHKRGCTVMFLALTVMILIGFCFFSSLGGFKCFSNQSEVAIHNKIPAFGADLRIHLAALCKARCRRAEKCFPVLLTVLHMDAIRRVPGCFFSLFMPFAL